MADKIYQLKYLPIFEQDLIEAVGYITNVLKNPYAAERLLEDMEKAIHERLQNPLSFEPYRSAKKRKHDYYRIYIRNYTVYYLVIDDIMEIRRLLYGSRDIERIL